MLEARVCACGAVALVHRPGKRTPIGSDPDRKLSQDNTLKLDEKGRPIPYYVWCEGEVVQVADGITTKRSKDKRCTKILPAGAVRIRWPADARRKEKETVGWTILNPQDFKREVIHGWRWAARELSTPPRGK